MSADFATADLVDAHEGRVQGCALQFRDYGGRRRFCGPIRTVRCRADNALFKSLLGEPGGGAVIVVDAGGWLDTAMIGDMNAAMGARQGWAGVIIHGAVRDVAALAQIDLGIKALGSNPIKSAKAGTGELDVPVSFGGVTFAPGAWVYCDEDGILVAPGSLESGGRA